MKTILLLLLGMAIPMCGCSSLKMVDLSEREDWIPGAQGDLLGQDATVTIVGGQGCSGTIVLLTPDSLQMLNEVGGTLFTTPLDHVSTIRQSPRVWPAIGGFVGGLLVGTLVGSALFVDAIIRDSEEEGTMSLLLPVIGAVAGAALVGSATSVTDYQMLYNSPRKVSLRPDRVMPDSTQQRK